MRKNEYSVVISSNDSNYKDDSGSGDDKSENSDESESDEGSNGGSQKESKPKKKTDKKSGDRPLSDNDQYHQAMAQRGESRYLQFVNSSPFCVFLVLVILTSISLVLSLQKNYFYKDM